MLLDLIVFFVPPLLGAFANQCLTLTSVKTRTASFSLAVIATSIGYEIMAFNMPFRAIWTELLCVVVGTLAVMLIMIAIPLNCKEALPSKSAGCARASVIFFLPFVSFTLVGRVNQAQQIAANWVGLVSQKYHSENHNVPSLALKQTDGSTTIIEGIDRPAWDAVIEHRSHLNKPAWSVWGDLDGKEMRIVPRRKVMFLGPFPD